MAPLAWVGGFVIAVLLDPSEYETVLGKVVAISLEADRYLLGRLKRLTQRRIYLTCDNAAFPPLVIERREMKQVFQCLFYNGPMI